MRTWLVSSLIAVSVASVAHAGLHPIDWQAKKGCLAHGLVNVLEDNVSNLSPVVVRSTCRSSAHNARVGGAKRSYHLSGNAVDFRVQRDKAPRVLKALLSDARVGGYKHYGSGKFHIDQGSRRTWLNNPRGKTRYASVPSRTSKLSSRSSPLNVSWDMSIGS